MEDAASRQHFKNLLSIAYADGILDKAELDFIFEKSGKYYITSDDIDGIIENHMRPKPNHIDDVEKRSRMMLDMIEMMRLDSEIHPTQQNFCCIFGVNIGYSEDVIETLVVESVNKLEDGKSQEEVLEYIQSLH